MLWHKGVENKMNTFEEFLDEKYDEIDNDSNNTNEAFEGRRDNWYENLDVQEIMDYAQEYAKYVQFETVSEIQDKLAQQTNQLHDELKNFNKE